MVETKEVFCIIRGRVQMVMFRDFVCRKARRMGIVGFVKNRDDGTVEVLAQGHEGHLRKFIDLLNRGSLLSRVDQVEVQWREPAMNFSNFSIRF